jgi:hypothetical protein
MNAKLNNAQVVITYVDASVKIVVKMKIVPSADVLNAVNHMTLTMVVKYAEGMFVQIAANVSNVFNALVLKIHALVLVNVGMVVRLQSKQFV